MSRILLADDSITIQKVVNLTFADEGIEVVAVSNGDMAEKRLSEISPDLVLADIFMPGKNGYELCESIKQNPQFQNIPVVLLVGAFEPFDQSEAKRVRADAHLTKPFESRALVETVRKLISTSGRVSAPLPPPPVVKQASGPLETQPLPAPPPINIDFSAMSDQASDQSSPTEAGSGFDFTSMSLPEAPPPIEIDVQPQPSNEETSGTLEFGSPFAPQPPFPMPPAQDFNLVFKETAHSAPAPVEPEPEAPPQPRAQEVGRASAFGYSTPDIMLDFEKVDEPVATAPENVVYDMESVSADEALDDELDTGKLDKSKPEPVSSGFAVIDQRGYEAAGEPAFRAEGVTTSLLTSESPLGDILLDERATTEPIYQPDPEPILQSVIETDYFEPSPATHQESDYSSSAWADAGQDAQPSGAQVVYESEAVEDFHVEALADSPVVPGFVEEKPFDFQSPDFSTPAFGTSEPTLEIATESQWEETTRELKSEDSDFEVAETQTMIFASEVPSDDDAGQYAHFTSSEMWTAQETEADALTPVLEETVATETVEDHETGFEFASTAAESAQAPAQAEEIQTADIQQQPTLSSEQVMQVVEIPETLIDEIVRRVVAQLSETVVREIAWEVVPDCVERIVREMSHDALQKK